MKFKTVRTLSDVVRKFDPSRETTKHLLENVPSIDDFIALMELKTGEIGLELDRANSQVCAYNGALGGVDVENIEIHNHPRGGFYPSVFDAGTTIREGRSVEYIIGKDCITKISYKADKRILICDSIDGGYDLPKVSFWERDLISGERVQISFTGLRPDQIIDELAKREYTAPTFIESYLVLPYQEQLYPPTNSVWAADIIVMPRVNIGKMLQTHGFWQVFGLHFDWLNSSYK